MADFHNIYDRLQEYYTCFSNNGDTGFVIDDAYYYGLPISSIHTRTNIPLEVIRKDIVTMRNWKENHLRFDEDIEENLSIQLSNALYNLEEDEFDQLLLNGIFDEVPIYFAKTNYAHYHIKLSPTEAFTYYRYHLKQPDGNRMNQFDSYQIKDSYRYTYTDKLTEKLEIINDAITKKYALHMEYTTSQGIHISITLSPLKITYDSMDNIYALLSLTEEGFRVYPLDRIQSLRKSNSRYSDYDAEQKLSIAPNVWGNGFSDEPYQVKVRFYNEGNVWHKVKKDLSYRINGKLYEENGYLYYEDTVYGLSAFRNWIFGYGSSAIVLEPQKLRKEILDSLLKRSL